MKTIKVGTRGSRLAQMQTELIIFHLQQLRTDQRFEPVIISSTGDKIKDLPLNQIGGSGLFTAELEAALLRGEVDFAVHSMKDLPVVQPEGLIALPYLRRGDARDALVFDGEVSAVAELPPAARIGTGSLRRTLQLKALRPDLRIMPIRGNVDTRLGKVGVSLDGVVLAAAGLLRAGLGERISIFLSPEELLPAPAQGILALECREDDKEIRKLLSDITGGETAIVSRAERAFLKSSGAGCHAPIAAYAVYSSELLTLHGLYGEEGSNGFVTGSIDGPAVEAAQLGTTLAVELLQRYKENYR